MRILDTKIGTNNERPELKIGEKLYKVDNRKKSFDVMLKVLNDISLEESAREEKFMELALGKSEAKEILGMDLTVEENKFLFYCIIALITGEEVETVKDRFINAKNL